MNLPFSELQFLDVFGQYNRTFGPAAAVLWLATLVAILMWVRSPARFGRVVAAVMALNWVWAGAVYHLALFTTINPAAYGFAVLFVAEAIILWWVGWRGDRLGTLSGSAFWRMAGIVFVGYAMLYPALVLASGFCYPRMPTFGVPCPTTLFTIGVLLMISPAPRLVTIIPIVWCAVGGSAAVLFGVYPDLALLVGGLVLLGNALVPRRGQLASAA